MESHKLPVEGEIAVHCEKTWLILVDKKEWEDLFGVCPTTHFLYSVWLTDSY